ncbi:MAG: hypothetical protein Q4C70_08805 [Planctomycetia bacterium]|nr:hypothetical protein [Planctomycetia bacterium]
MKREKLQKGWKVRIFAFLFTLMGLFSGCEGEKNTCCWEGMVLISGKEIPADATARITVSSRNATGASQVDSAPITGGKYVLEQVPKGNVSVHFDIVLETPAKNPEDAARGMTDVKDLLPKKFKNDMDDVADADNREKNFDLK